MYKILITLLLIVSGSAFSQFRDDGLPPPNVKDGIINSSSPSLFGFLNSDDFIMRHSFSMNYSSFGGQGLAVGMYTNSMYYRLMDNLNVQLDVSVAHSPYSTLGDAYQKSISGIYISNAAINYQPFKDVHVHLQYRTMPFGYGLYNPFYGFYSPFRENPFGSQTNPFSTNNNE